MLGCNCEEVFRLAFAGLALCCLCAIYKIRYAQPFELAWNPAVKSREKWDLLSKWQHIWLMQAERTRTVWGYLSLKWLAWQAGASLLSPPSLPCLALFGGVFPSQVSCHMDEKGPQMPKDVLLLLSLRSLYCLVLIVWQSKHLLWRANCLDWHTLQAQA